MATRQQRPNGSKFKAPNDKTNPGRPQAKAHLDLAATTTKACTPSIRTAKSRAQSLASPRASLSPHRHPNRSPPAAAVAASRGRRRQPRPSSPAAAVVASRGRRRQPRPSSPAAAVVAGRRGGHPITLTATAVAAPAAVAPSPLATNVAPSPSQLSRLLQPLPRYLSLPPSPRHPHSRRGSYGDRPVTLAVEAVATTHHFHRRRHTASGSRHCRRGARPLPVAVALALPRARHDRHPPPTIATAMRAYIKPR
ncbi:hypothetical protein J3R03_008532 [Actinoplanes couchii]|nr:hypothetical protein [Actinoplanes couchii]